MGCRNPDCHAAARGYAAFTDGCAELFEPWLAPAPVELEHRSAEQRLREVQHLLCDLLETLAVNGARYEDLQCA